MLGVKNYTREYVDACRARVTEAVGEYVSLPPVAKSPALEAAFFASLLLNLDYMFVHRLRMLEGKDGNALNEVRMLCASLLEHRGVFTRDKSITLKPEQSLLATQFGDEVAITEDSFQRLAAAFFSEIEARYL